MVDTAAAAAIRTVGVIGAGRMGQPIIGHLARKGFTVLVHDVDAAKRDAVTRLGGEWAGDLALLARGDAILVCVGYDRQLRDLMSPAGLLADLPAGTIVAVLSTVLPGTVQEIARDAATVGVHVVDSTVCRGGRAADAG